MTDAPELTSRQRKHLRGLAHALEPVVRLGATGLTEGAAREIDAALLAHELIKVRLNPPEERKALAAEIAERTGSTLCGVIGHIAILHRAHPEKPRVSPGPAR